MNELRKHVRGLLRGARVSRILQWFDIDPKRFWLLVDLFAQLGERGEMTDQLGRNRFALKSGAIVYFLLSAIFAVVFGMGRPAVSAYLSSFLFLTAFFLMSVLVSEAGNSLINPQEALVLAHQPVNGATYTAAKLSHLVRVVLWLTGAIDLLPAVAGLLLKNAGWYYPVLHLVAAFGVGIASALFCCSLFGWMVRFVPIRRLKAAGQLAGSLPFVFMLWGQDLWRRLANLHPAGWLPVTPGPRIALASFICIALFAVAGLGIRALSADYLIRVSALTRGGASALSRAGNRSRRSFVGTIVRRFFGGQPALAGFSFVSRMMLRDWQFRRQMLPTLIYAVFGIGSLAVKGWPSDPVGGRHFSSVHVLPHVQGLMLFFVCMVLPYGNDYKGVWFFLSVPSGALDGFTRGVFALLWIDFILFPHLIALPLLAWRWGIAHAALFAAWSAAAASVYLALEVRLVDEVPFGKQMDNSRGTMTIPLMLGGGLIAAVSVALQYFVIFRSVPAIVLTVVTLVVTAYFATKASLKAAASSMRYHLGLISEDGGKLYREVGA